MYESKDMKNPTKISKIVNTCKSFYNDESGVSAIEYGLLAGLVSTAIIGGTTMLGDGVSDTFEKSADHVSGGAGSAQGSPSGGIPFNAPPANSLGAPAPEYSYGG